MKRAYKNDLTKTQVSRSAGRDVLMRECKGPDGTQEVGRGAKASGPQVGQGRASGAPAAAAGVVGKEGAPAAPRLPPRRAPARPAPGRPLLPPPTRAACPLRHAVRSSAAVARAAAVARPRPQLCLLYPSPSPRNRTRSRLPSSALKKTRQNLVDGSQLGQLFGMCLIQRRSRTLSILCSMPFQNYSCCMVGICSTCR